GAPSLRSTWPRLVQTSRAGRPRKRPPQLAASFIILKPPARCRLLAQSGQSDSACVCPLLDNSGQRRTLARDGLSAPLALAHLLGLVGRHHLFRRGGLDLFCPLR